jgi:hypothetical protein
MLQPSAQIDRALPIRIGQRTPRYGCVSPRPARRCCAGIDEQTHRCAFADHVAAAKGPTPSLRVFPAPAHAPTHAPAQMGPVQDGDATHEPILRLPKRREYVRTRRARAPALVAALRVVVRARVGSLAAVVLLCALILVLASHRAARVRRSRRSSSQRASSQYVCLRTERPTSGRTAHRPPGVTLVHPSLESSPPPRDSHPVLAAHDPVMHALKLEQSKWDRY